MDVIERVVIAATVKVNCAEGCGAFMSVQFDKRGVTALRDMSFLDGNFVIEYFDVQHSWTVLPDGRAWCPSHRLKIKKAYIDLATPSIERPKRKIVIKEKKDA